MLLLAALLFSLLQSSHQECRPEYERSKFEKTHTACLPPNEACVIKKRGLSAKEKKEILNIHNDLRSQVAKGKLSRFPPAQDMLQLQWDDELAEIAQAHSDQCGFELKHDHPTQRLTTKFPSVGQNLASVSSSHKNLSADVHPQVKSWFGEHTKYASNQVGTVFDPRIAEKVGHFTQVIWARTGFVGCGFTAYTMRDDTGPFPHKRIYTCNYAPAGNVLGAHVYREGEPCSACPPHTKCNKDTGLCVS